MRGLKGEKVFRDAKFESPNWLSQIQKVFVEFTKVSSKTIYNISLKLVVNLVILINRSTSYKKFV